MAASAVEHHTPGPARRRNSRRPAGGKALGRSDREGRQRSWHRLRPLAKAQTGSGSRCTEPFGRCSGSAYSRRRGSEGNQRTDGRAWRRRMRRGFVGAVGRIRGRTTDRSRRKGQCSLAGPTARDMRMTGAREGVRGGATRCGTGVRCGIAGGRVCTYLGLSRRSPRGPARRTRPPTGLLLRRRQPATRCIPGCAGMTILLRRRMNQMNSKLARALSY
ncbi:hypothetical protein VTK56DRAFT_3233 [Thermocarpiscus australiensis]